MSAISYYLDQNFPLSNRPVPRPPVPKDAAQLRAAAAARQKAYREKHKAEINARQRRKYFKEVYQV